MALTPSKDQKLNPNDIVKAYREVVINAIIQDCYDVMNQPTYAGNLCVPTEIMGNLTTELYDGVVGFKDEKDVGNSTTLIDIYNSLIDVTKYLLRVGTFTYELYTEWTKYGTSTPKGTGANQIGSASGKVFFTQAYAQDPVGESNKYKTSTKSKPQVTNTSYTDSQDHRADFRNAKKDTNHPKGSYPNHLVGVDNGGVLSTRIFSAQSINNLLTNCYNAWNNSGRPVYGQKDYICHSSCHNSCHSNCYSDCYGDCASNPVGYACNCYNNAHMADGTYLNITCNYIYEDV